MIHYYENMIFVMYNTKSEPCCKLWSLGSNDLSMYSH
jgi:hypothetical protein